MNFNRAIVAYYTFVSAQVKRTFRLWAQTMLPAAITTTMYFMIFGHLMGQRIGTMAGLSYIDFIVPGLVMMTMLNSSFNATVSVYYMYKWTKVIEEMLVSPMSSIIILLSFMSVGIIRSALIGIIVIIIAMFFTDVTIVHFFYMVFIAVLAGGIFSLFGILNAIFAKNFDQISIIPTFVITPLTYLGGVFYSINILPHFWQKVSLFNPIVYIISAFRYGFESYADTNILVSTMIMLFIFFVLFCTCYYLIRIRKGISD